MSIKTMNKHLNSLKKCFKNMIQANKMKFLNKLKKTHL